MKKYLLFLVSFVISCSQSDTKKVSFIKTYEGQIGKYPITMKLIVEEGKVSGNYFYNKVGDYLTLDGTVISDSISLNAFDKANNLCDNFKGVITNGKISGIWSKPNGQNQLNFSMIESSISFPPESLNKEVNKFSLIDKVWYSNDNDAYVPMWMSFSKDGKYKMWLENNSEPVEYTGTWTLKKNVLELISSELNEISGYEIYNLKQNSFEIISIKPSAGSQKFILKENL